MVVDTEISKGTYTISYRLNAYPKQRIGKRLGVWWAF